ncbi:hypothetical protein [Nostoc sp. 'Peltigera malacea cyanobiont' DB3992]|uniref:hypothetical protein n=1 Tax=Nostoc sp. 'Peltigera malacea cyanobiont' DB3992 TaxID=1206980 RepID=UPI00211F145E|nr:hypothetical protein [Nostoc sp. 'Peltigera malacea cyanobiont' DB3992]
MVHPGKDWITEGETKKYWQQRIGLFDGTEQLNATETVKRCLHKILPTLLNISKDKIAVSYPDLTSGVAGYLKNADYEELKTFNRTCAAVKNWVDDQGQKLDVIHEKWGIPWIDKHQNPEFKQFHPRLLNLGWLVEDLEISPDLINDYRQDIAKIINKYYPSNNPADWYVLAAGDGDDMSKWLQGEKLKEYRDYILPNYQYL